MLITRHADAVAVLADGRYVPPPVDRNGAPGTLRWLRAEVSRFSSGYAHTERRRKVTELLATLEPTELRAAARVPAAELRAAARVPAAQKAEGVAARVLGAALGVTELDTLVAAVGAAAEGYLSGRESPEADAAVATLLRLVGDVSAITILLQAHAATTGLIAGALAHDDGVSAVEDLLHETLRHDPPVKLLKRVGVEIDVVSVNRDPEVFPEPDRFDPGRGRTPYLTFGHGARQCPASAHALAIAAGCLEGSRT